MHGRVLLQREKAYYYVSKDPIKQSLAQFASSKQELLEDEASKKREKDGDPDFSYKSGWGTDDVACLTSPEKSGKTLRRPLQPFDEINEQKII